MKKEELDSLKEKFRKSNENLLERFKTLKYDDSDDCLFLTYGSVALTKKSYLLKIDEGVSVRMNSNMKIQAIIVEDFMTFYAKNNPDFMILYNLLKDKKNKERVALEKALSTNLMRDFYVKENKILANCCMPA